MNTAEHSQWGEVVSEVWYVKPVANNTDSESSRRQNIAAVGTILRLPQMADAPNCNTYARFGLAWA